MRGSGKKEASSASLLLGELGLLLNLQVRFGNHLPLGEKKKPKKQNKIAYSNKCPISKIIQLPCAGTETNIPASLKMLREPETNEGGRLLCSRKLSSWPWTPIGALRESQDTLVPALPNSGMWALGKGRGELTTSATLSIVGWKVW